MNTLVRLNIRGYSVSISGSTFSNFVICGAIIKNHYFEVINNEQSNQQTGKSQISKYIEVMNQAKSAFEMINFAATESYSSSYTITLDGNTFEGFSNRRTQIT